VFCDLRIMVREKRYVKLSGL